jgi:hypothetical protein
MRNEKQNHSNSQNFNRNIIKFNRRATIEKSIKVRKIKQLIKKDKQEKYKIM